MGFDHKPGVRLGGNTKKEKTREELLEVVRAERAARNDVRRKATAAVVIQRFWRGWMARAALRRQNLQTLLQTYAPFVAQQEQYLTSEQVVADLLPRALMLLLPQAPGMPMDLTATRHAGSTPTAAGTPLMKAARAVLALLMRSFTAPQPAHNCLALELSAEGRDKLAARWKYQAPRLLQLLCGVVMCPGGDGLLDSVALRLLAIMTDERQWKLEAGPGDKARGAAQLKAHLILQPAPLFAALSRILAAAAPAAAPASGAGSASSPTAGQGRTTGAAGPTPPAAAATGQAAVGAPAVLLQKMLPLVVEVLQAGLQQRAQAPGAGAPAAAAAMSCMETFVRSVLLAPHACEQLSEEVKEQLRLPHVAAMLCQALVTQGSAAAARARPARKAVEAGGTGGASESADVPRAVDPLWGLANITLLLAGQYKTSQLASGKQVFVFVGAPRCMADAQVAEAFAAATAQLLPRAVSAAVAAIRGPGGASAAPAAAAAASRLWPLGQRTFMMQLLATLESKNGGVQLFSQLCDAALRQLPELVRALTEVKQAASEVPSVLNTLAFAPSLLPRLWKWLCPQLGLPLECPQAATRGLDIASLAQGYAGMDPRHALVLGIFCRLYTHLLLVLDDGEFYEGSDPFTLPQARAVVTSLNSLVYHTYLPKGNKLTPEQQQEQAPPLLAEYAPLLLRSLYERDVRRSFCQPLLWLAPYTEMFGKAEPVTSTPPAPSESGEGGVVPAIIGTFSAAAVLQSLIYSVAGGGDERDEDAGGALQAKAGEGSRPSSLAALLRTAPQAVPFARRVDLFRTLLSEDKARGRFDRPPYEGGTPPIKVTIRRSSLMEDAYRGLAGLGPALKARLVVTFVNEQGLSEAGLDYGGLMKEFLEEVVRTGFNADYGLFSTSPEGLAYPRPSADKVDMGLQLLEFLGLMVGKALYEGILLNVGFAHFFIMRLQGRAPLFDDLRTLDPDLHRSLMQVKRYEGDVEDLGLTFSVDDDFFGTTTQVELLPGRGAQSVTNENKLLYCHLLADWHLNGKLGRAAQAFADGLSQIIPTTSLRLFNPKEFNQLISGDSGDGSGPDVDVEDMKRYVRYHGGYREDSTTIKLFWKVVGDMSPLEVGQLLKFVTSCSRAPLGGFRYLQPPLTIHKVDCDASLFAVLGGQDVDRLPSASTCYNMLKLPNYRRASTLKKKLLYAIGSGAGFELS